MDKNRMNARLLALILSLVMIVSGSVLTAFATDEPVTDDEILSTEQNIDDQAPADDDGGLTPAPALLGAAPAAEPETDDSVVVPQNVAVNVSGTKITVTWDTVEGVLYDVEIKSGGNPYDYYQNVASGVTAALERGKSYTVRVGAYFDGGEPEDWSAEASFDVPASAFTAAPAVTKMSIPNQGIVPNDKSEQTKYMQAGNLVTIYWSKAAGAVKSYSVIRVDSKGAEKVIKKDLSASTTKYQFRSSAGTFSYKIRAFAADPTDYIDSNLYKAPKVISYLKKSNIDDYCWYVTTDTKVTLYKKGTGSAKYGTIAKGQKGTAIGKYPKSITKWNKPKRIQVKFNNGKTGWVQFSKLSFSPNVNITVDYPYDVKMDLVNSYVAKGKIKTKYFVWVNKYTERVNIFQKVDGKYKLIRNCRCTIANFYQPVSSGWKILKNKYAKKTMLDDKGRLYYFNYARTFGGSGYFHTRSYWANGKAKNNVQKRPSTKGCIRMYTDDAKFVYNLPKGTNVLFR